MSFKLAQALRSGRREAQPPSREAILAGLLSQRAAAARAGLHELERLLRNQILWSLPVRRQDHDTPAPADTQPPEGTGDEDISTRE